MLLNTLRKIDINFSYCEILQELIPHPKRRRCYGFNFCVRQVWAKKPNFSQCSSHVSY